MKISSQLANNFYYCSVEIGVFLDQELFTLRAQRLRAVSSLLIDTICALCVLCG
jgi:hypothetical protein